MDGGRRFISQFIIMLVCICFHLERWICLTDAANNSGQVIVEILVRPEDCEKTAAEGDLLSVRFTESRSSTDAAGDAREAMVTLGDTGIINGWNEGLLGACEGELRRLIMPATLAYSELPPGLQSNVNITYDIFIVAIDKPVPDNPLIDNSVDFEDEVSSIAHVEVDVFMTTITVLTEESKEDKEREVKIDKDSTQVGGGKSGAGDNASSLSIIHILQYAVIPVAVILALVVIYYLYKLRHPHKRTTFYKGPTGV